MFVEGFEECVWGPAVSPDEELPAVAEEGEVRGVGNEQRGRGHHGGQEEKDWRPLPHPAGNGSNASGHERAGESPATSNNSADGRYRRHAPTGEMGAIRLDRPPCSLACHLRRLLGGLAG